MKVPMQACKSNALSAFGNQLVDDISLPVQQLNLLFSALLLTAVGVFIGANLLCSIQERWHGRRRLHCLAWVYF